MQKKSMFKRLKQLNKELLVALQCQMSLNCCRVDFIESTLLISAENKFYRVSIDY